MSHAASALLASSLAVLLVAACGGKGSTKPASTQPQGGQAGAPAQGASTAGSFSSSGAGGEAGLDQDPADAIPCVNDPLGRLPPCELVANRPVPGPRPLCPDNEPAVDEACTEAGLLCSYGDAATPLCRHYYECAEARWRVDPRIDPERYRCAEPPEDYCPAETPTAGTPCTPEGAWSLCLYPDVTCSCMENDHWAAPARTWLCYGPPSDPDCPKALPNVGEGCTTQGVQCSYIEDCDFPPYSTVFCRDGAWEEGERGTPCLP